MSAARSFSFSFALHVHTPCRVWYLLHNLRFCLGLVHEWKLQRSRTRRRKLGAPMLSAGHRDSCKTPTEVFICKVLEVSHAMSMFNSKLHYVQQRIIVIVIVNSIFLQCPQKRSRGNQLIHRRLSKSKSIGSGSDPESQAGRQTDGYGGGVWSWDGEGGREKRTNQDRIYWREMF